MSPTKTVAAGLLASTFALTSVAPASAGGGDVAAGLVGGFILGTIVNEGMHQKRSQRTYKRTTRRVQDPAVTEYWRNVQSALNETGYPVGRVDGVAGRKTRAGVRDFQMSLGEEPTGTLSNDQYAVLMQRAGYAPSTAMAYPPAGGPVDAPYPGDPALAPPAGYADAPAYAPDAVAPPPVATPAAPALTLATTTTRAVAPALEAFDAPVRMSDAALDDVAANLSVLGIGIGSPRAEAAEVFADSVGSCKDTGAYTACTGGNEAYTDDVAFATAGSDDAAPVYLVTRTLAFNQPVPSDALRAKLAESLGPIVDDADMTLSNAGECDRALSGEGAVVMTASLRSHARGSDPEALADVTGKCRAFFAMSMDEGAAGVTRVTVRLFDGRMLEPVTATAAAPAAPAAEAPALPDAVKF